MDPTVYGSPFLMVTTHYIYIVIMQMPGGEGGLSSIERGVVWCQRGKSQMWREPTECLFFSAQIVVCCVLWEKMESGRVVGKKFFFLFELCSDEN